MEQDRIFIGGGERDVHLLLKMANRHGLVAGATGTGKTVTLRILAEGFSACGVPVFLADVKGDLAGISQPGEIIPPFASRAAAIGLQDYAPAAFPVQFWDLYGRQGHPLRTTVSEMGPLLLSRLLELNDTQEGVLNIAFRVADEQGLLLLDLKDLRALLNFVGEQAKELTLEYGHVSPNSVGAIQRRLLVLEQQGVEQFFGEPALELADLMTRDDRGRGMINILAADRLMANPRLYSTLLLWLLAELFEELPEVGDPDRPRLVFFFDEAHLLFDTAPKALLDKIEQVVRLIRSKGVGIYFVTQSPGDIPDDVLGQLGNRIQHALRAFTPRDRKRVTTAAETFRPNPAFDAAAVITELGVGEALVSTLDRKGIPEPVERTLIRPPASRLGTLDEALRRGVVASSALRGKYDQMVDRDSAYEHLRRQAARAAAAQAEQHGQAPAAARGRRSSSRQSVGEALTKSVARSMGSQLGRSLMRGLLGALFRR
ncbi:ATP-binding protein [Thiohalobacter sp. COW1]|uniref:helicase HerA-like domain-containing protein n=1 Tax=Thiohalobacter sp. COW1 TaxID=2795687 RepID=UPI001915C49F|nr:helicase HerA-like domain-containing protein [Thiohalobacter sp. COW1]BCO31923.1 ATP-binding protein [Thiohalobacter sp. COW1]